MDRHRDDLGARRLHAVAGESMAWQIHADTESCLFSGATSGTVEGVLFQKIVDRRKSNGEKKSNVAISAEFRSIPIVLASPLSFRGAAR
jgi:hypothetical protein